MTKKTKIKYFLITIFISDLTHYKKYNTWSMKIVKNYYSHYISKILCLNQKFLQFYLFPPF